MRPLSDYATTLFLALAARYVTADTLAFGRRYQPSQHRMKK